MSLNVKRFEYPVEQYFLVHDNGDGKKQIGVTMKISDAMPYFGNKGNTREQNTRSPFYQKIKTTFISSPLVNYFNPPIVCWAKKVELLPGNRVVSEHIEGKDGVFDGAHRQDIIAEILRERLLQGDRNVTFIFYVGFDPKDDMDLRVDIASRHNQIKGNKSHSIDDTRGYFECIKQVFNPLNIRIQYKENEYKSTDKNVLKVSVLIPYLSCFMSDLFPSPDDRNYYSVTPERMRIQVVRHPSECREFYIKNIDAYAQNAHLFPQILELVEMIRFESVAWFKESGNELITETFVTSKNRMIYTAQEKMITPVKKLPVCYKVSDERLEKRNWLGLVDSVTFLVASSFRHLLKDGAWVADFDEIKAFVKESVPEMLLEIRARRKEVLSMNDYLRMELTNDKDGGKKFAKSPWDKFYEQTKLLWKQHQTLNTARGIPAQESSSSPSFILRKGPREQTASL